MQEEKMKEKENIVFYANRLICYRPHLDLTVI